MSKVSEAFDKLIRELELIGYSTDSAIELINTDIVKAKKDIEKYYEHIEERIDIYIDSQVDLRKGD